MKNPSGITLNWDAFGVIERAHTVYGHYTIFEAARNSVASTPYQMPAFQLVGETGAYSWILRLYESKGVNLEIYPAKDTYFPSDGIISEIKTFNPDPAAVT